FKNEKRLPKTLRVALYFIDKLLTLGKNECVLRLLSKIQAPLSLEDSLLVDERMIFAFLQQRKFDKAEKILRKYPIEYLSSEDSPLFSLYGCWLTVTEGKEIAYIHFSATLEEAYPKSWTLLGHYIGGKKDDLDLWLTRAFSYEKKQLY